MKIKILLFLFNSFMASYHTKPEIVENRPSGSILFRPKEKRAIKIPKKEDKSGFNERIIRPGELTCCIYKT